MTFFITPFHYTDCFSVRQIGYGGKIVRGMSVSLTDLPVLLQTIKSGSTLGQNVPKSDPTDKEDSE